ncbi:MAG: protein kinase [Myxococcales bacterium]
MRYPSAVLLQPNQQLGQYRIVRLLGEGGMGAVYEAVHVELNRRVALKTLKTEVENLPTVLERFLREGRAAARIRHPHVVDVLDAGQIDGTAYLVMEFLEGEDLEVLLRRETRLAMARVTEIMIPVMAAVDAVHRQGIIHRDLKPQNIFLIRGPYGEPSPKVLDFGISKVAASNSNLTSVGEALGSPFYMSPEQARGMRTLDARSDQFALAVILYELLTGVRPFDAPNAFAVLVAIQSAAPVPLGERLPELPAPFAAAVARALSREPADRFESVLEFGRALLPFASERTKVLWTPLFGAPADPEPEADLEATPVHDRTVMRANPLEPVAVSPRRAPLGTGKGGAASQPPLKQRVATDSTRAPLVSPNRSPSGSTRAPVAASVSGSFSAPRTPTGSTRAPVVASVSGSFSVPRASTGSTRAPVGPAVGAQPTPKATTGSLRPAAGPSSIPPRTPVAQAKSRSGVAAHAPRRDTPPAPPRAAAPAEPARRDTPAAPPRALVPARSRPVEEASDATVFDADPEPGPAQAPAPAPASSSEGACLCLSASDPAVHKRVCQAVRSSPRLVLLLEAKGPAPEERPPLVQVLEAAGTAIDVVIVVDDARSGWRQPMVEICRELVPDRQDAPRSYLFFEKAQLAHAIRKGSTNPLADAEKITEWLSKKVPGTRRFRR